MTENKYSSKDEYIYSMMKQFKLVDMREQFRDLVNEAEAASMSYVDFVCRLMSVEEDGKWLRKITKLRR